MTGRMSSRALSFAVVLALLLTALAPQPASADEGTPPPPPDASIESFPEASDTGAADPTPAPSADPAVAEAPPGEGVLDAPAPEPVPELDPSSIESPPAPAEALPDAVGSAAPEAPPEAAVDSLAAVPEGTTIAVVDAAGVPVPLVSDEATHILQTGDPIWCPASVKAPVWDATSNGLNGCRDPKTSLKEVLDDLQTDQPAVDGVIWIAASYDSGTQEPGVNFTLDGTQPGYATLSLYRLTLRGGWDGLNGSKLIDPLDPSEFNGRLWIANWQNDVTLTDLEYANVSGGIGVQVGTSGSITLTRVRAHDSASHGAVLDTTAGTGKVTVTASQFNGNGGHGLSVSSLGAITLADITANGNTNYGADLGNSGAGAVGGITLTGVNIFDDNGDSGLDAHSLGKITLANLSANRNGAGGGYRTGAILENNFGTAVSGSPGITLTGTNIFTENGSIGLNIRTFGPVVLSNVTANGSAAGTGAQVFNSDASIAQPVTLSGTNTFKHNFTYGLYVDSKGKITVNNVTASSNNGAAGAWLTNDNDLASDVLLTGTGVFLDNAHDGLYVRSLGAIKASNLTASRNGVITGVGSGADLANDAAVSPKPVTLTGTNVFQGNNDNGLRIASEGAITASNLTGSGTAHGPGVALANGFDLAGQTVTLTGVNVFNDNYFCGLSVSSKGAVSLNSLSASGNGLLYHAGFGVAVSNEFSSTPQPVKITGTNSMTGNYDGGLRVDSLGAVSVANLTARGSVVGDGATIYNQSGTGSVTFSGTNVFTDNQSSGILIISSGAINLSNVTASGSATYSGASLGNSSGSPASPPGVTISGTSVFDGNAISGLFVNSIGTITLADVTARDNGDSGLDLDNTGGTLVRNVTISGSALVSGNGAYGLVVLTPGAVKINNLAATGNGGTGLGWPGAYIVNSSGTAGVTLSGASSFRDNAEHGLHIVSRGTISAANLTASGNGFIVGGGGAWLENQGASTPQAVTLTGVNVFTGNSEFGLGINSVGAISVANLTASETPDGSGAYLNNEYPSPTSASPGVTLSGVVSLLSNDEAGLVVESYGPITLKTSHLTAQGNDNGSGVSLNNDDASSPMKVTVAGSSLVKGNSTTGLSIYSAGAISLGNITATENGSGLYLNTHGVGAAGSVVLTGSNMLNDNFNTGLTIYSVGPISLSNVTASGNGLNATDSGAIIANHTATTPQPVKLTGVNVFNDNYYDGLNIHSKGAITISSLTASGNLHSGGAYLQNNTGGTGAVTLTGSNAFHDNGGDGLGIYAGGAITLNSVAASGNDGSGVYLDNTGAAAQAIKLTGTNSFNDNTLGGLYAFSLGAITANSLSASRNGTYGAELSNSTGTQGITLTGVNTFNDNTLDGLTIGSLGTVQLTKVTADHNGSGGISIAGPASSITITCGSVTSNNTFGIFANTAGLLSLVGVISAGNGSLDSLTYADLDIVRACPLP